MVGLARRLEARPGPATAHGYRSQTLSARWSGGLKPSSPLLACACVGLKPPSPLRARNGRFCCSLGAQRCRRFQSSLVGGEQWCCWFQCRHVVAPCARNFSPCGAVFIAHARKSSPFKPKTGEKCCFQACWANYFAEMPLEGLCWASFFAPIDPELRSCRRRGARGWLRWGFCSIRSWLAACRRRVVPLVTPFPPFGDGLAGPPPIGLTCAGT